MLVFTFDLGSAGRPLPYLMVDEPGPAPKKIIALGPDGRSMWDWTEINRTFSNCRVVAQKGNFAMWMSVPAIMTDEGDAPGVVVRILHPGLPGGTLDFTEEQVAQALAPQEPVTV